MREIYLDAEQEAGFIAPIIEVVGVRTVERLGIHQGVGNCCIALPGTFTAVLTVSMRGYIEDVRH